MLGTQKMHKFNETQLESINIELFGQTKLEDIAINLVLLGCP